MGSVGPRPQRGPWRRQFPSKALSILFNFELKCKQGSAPSAPAPNQIRCCDFSVGGGQPSGEGAWVKNQPANAGNIRDVGSIPGSGRSLEESMATHPLQYSHLENPMDRGAWRATVRGVIPGLGRSPGGGCGNPLQYPGLENSLD